MTAHRRPLLVSTLALLLPACLHVDESPYAVQSDQTTKSPSTASDSVRKTQFAELISRPGVVVFTKPSTKDQASLPPSDPPGTVQPASKSADPVDATPPKQTQDPPLVVAVRAYAEGRPNQAIEFLAGLDKANQDFVLNLLPILARGATLDMNADPTATAILADQLRGAAGRIESKASLRIEAAMLCKRVTAFGSYIPWTKGQSYRPNELAQFYIEVRNLVSQPTVGPNGESLLTYALGTAEIRDAHGKLVDQISPDGYRRMVPVVQFESKKRYTHTPVHDFHMLYEFQIPREVGVYTISIKIQDPASRRVAKIEPVEFTVAGP